VPPEIVELACDPDPVQALKVSVLGVTVGQFGLAGEKVEQSPVGVPPPLPLSGPGTLENVVVMKRPLASVMISVSGSTHPLVIAVKKPPEVSTGEPRIMTKVGSDADIVYGGVPPNTK
jgi:hypothetical protein